MNPPAKSNTVSHSGTPACPLPHPTDSTRFWQQVEYREPGLLSSVLTRLGDTPGIVAPGEINALRNELARAQRGECFIVQSGDCAERFFQCHATDVQRRWLLAAWLRTWVSQHVGRPVVSIGRIAGQYAKPRSNATEQRGHVTLPAYRGDMINDHPFCYAGRHHDPLRLWQAYEASRTTYLLLQQLALPGASSDLVRQALTDEILAAATPQAAAWPQLHQLLGQSLAPFDLYTSHEALHLDYERALLRHAGVTYASSAHLLWLGERTRSLAAPHLTLLTPIHNPVGIKLGPSAQPDEIVALLERLNPERSLGKIMLITRFGRSKAENLLPALVRAVMHSGHPVCWLVDPMHGNTYSISGVKTRNLVDLCAEVLEVHDVLRSHGLELAGLHLETTPDPVTECLSSGLCDVTPRRLKDNYTTACDPRLSPLQAFSLVAQSLGRGRSETWNSGPTSPDGRCTTS